MSVQDGRYMYKLFSAIFDSLDPVYYDPYEDLISIRMGYNEQPTKIRFHHSSTFSSAIFTRNRNDPTKPLLSGALALH